MALFVAKHQHSPETCPAGDPQMGPMLLQHLSKDNAAKYGISIHGEAVIDGQHTLYMILDASDSEKINEFLAPFAPLASRSAEVADDLPLKEGDDGSRPGGSLDPLSDRGGESTRTLVLVPSLSLLAQTPRERAANAERAFRYRAVCSDETVVGEDAVVSTTSDLPEHGPAHAAP